MTDFVSRIDQILQDKNLKRAALCADLDLSQTAITDWARRNTIPAGDICLKIADYLGVSMEWLLTGKESSLSTEERRLLKQWAILSPDQKDTVCTLLDKWESEYQAREKKELNA
jgi:transcriptional regulator with XRE-family HTH domain